MARAHRVSLARKVSDGRKLSALNWGGGWEAQTDPGCVTLLGRVDRALRNSAPDLVKPRCAAFFLLHF